MKRTILLITVFLGSLAVNAQEDTEVRITNANKDRLVEMTYLYPFFKGGRIFFVNGGSSGAHFNYSLVLGEMHFIDRRKDTLALDGLEAVKFVAVEDDTFYYDVASKEYLFQVSDHGNVKLLASQRYKFLTRMKKAAYGGYSDTQASSSWNNYEGGGDQYLSLDSDQYIVYNKKIRFFIKSQGGSYILANKPNLLRVFSKHQHALKRFIKENKTDFTKAEDLRALLNYCMSLV